MPLTHTHTGSVRHKLSLEDISKSLAYRRFILSHLGVSHAIATISCHFLITELKCKSIGFQQVLGLYYCFHCSQTLGSVSLLICCGCENSPVVRTENHFHSLWGFRSVFLSDYSNNIRCCASRAGINLHRIHVNIYLPSQIVCSFSFSF